MLWSFSWQSGRGHILPRVSSQVVHAASGLLCCPSRFLDFSFQENRHYDGTISVQEDMRTQQSMPPTVKPKEGGIKFPCQPWRWWAPKNGLRYGIVPGDTSIRSMHSRSMRAKQNFLKHRGQNKEKRKEVAVRGKKWTVGLYQNCQLDLCGYPSPNKTQRGFPVTTWAQAMPTGLTSVARRQGSQKAPRI